MEKTKQPEFETRVGRRGEVGGSPIQLCDDHASTVDTALVNVGFERNKLMPSILEVPNNKNPPAPGIIAFQMLTSIALRTMGSEGVIRHGGCPICAFQKFEWAEEIAKVVSLQLLGPQKVM